MALISGRAGYATGTAWGRTHHGCWESRANGVRELEELCSGGSEVVLRLLFEALIVCVGRGDEVQVCLRLERRG